MTSSGRRRWDESSFFEDAEAKLEARDLEALRRLYEYGQSGRYEMKWGSGGKKGSFGLVRADVCPRTFVTAVSNGRLWVNFGWLKGTEAAERFRDHLHGVITKKLGLPLPKDQHFAVIKSQEWRDKVDDLLSALDELRTLSLE